MGTSTSNSKTISTAAKYALFRVVSNKTLYAAWQNTSGCMATNNFCLE